MSFQEIMMTETISVAPNASRDERIAWWRGVRAAA
jgi:hypothetical protein